MIQHKLELKIRLTSMAKAKGGSTSASGWQATPKKRRPGVHSKKKNSVNKKGKHYIKKNRGQGTRR